MSIRVEPKELKQQQYREKLAMKLLECVEEIAASAVEPVRIEIYPDSVSSDTSKDARITTDPDKMGGVPCIRGLRIPASTIVKLVACGMTAEEILTDYPDLEREDISSALSFAASAVQKRHVRIDCGQ